MDNRYGAVVALVLLTSAGVILVCLLAANHFPLVSAATRRPVLYLVPTPASHLASGCGSRGGPGVRLSSGKCASWEQVGHVKP